ncbi:ATP phosphoribosyltransferase regulatory subunit [Sphingomonas sp.]|jgi:ATP phosphoribosyltransferase regulatory subunit|uniref:ATP phosphoribosyltransferase regulatory subunit n=1 Tax=Sphingomonas sp. TaxID=28214 RepID=UPI002E32E58A|nr:ATP phosphoribosyltransferase regulatory subunit [Sphingomonas sp.]HEX4695662.1 ATP phosphoribosyltransferase regulatory subunit [Sphingomonas sp.]
MTHALLPSGFHDRLPPDADAAARLERRVLDEAHGHGYERVDPPLAEFEDALAHRLKSARAQDSVRFVDPISQRSLAIRPDITAQVGRIAATRMGHHPRPVRLSYAGSVLRLRASELEPERERRQAGCELIGLDTVAAAQEIVTVAVEALEAAGVTGISIDFTLPDLLATLAAGPLPLEGASLDELAGRLDAKDAGAVTALAPGYLPMIEAAGPFDSAYDRLRRFDAGGALASRLDGLSKVAECVRGRAQLTLDPTERHGFEYQTWFGFSLFAEESRGEIGRGGSYTIVHEDGAEEAAIGFTLYVDAIVAAGSGANERRRLFVPLGTDPALTAELRGQGWVTVAALEPGDTPEAQLCTHMLAEGKPRPL